MATTIREFVVELGVDADTAGLARYRKGVEKVKRGLQGLVRVAAGAVAGVTAIGGALFTAAERAGAFSKKILEQSRAVGVATDTYQGLVFAAQKFNAEAQDVQDLLSVLADRAEDATRGTKSFVEAFGLIGIEAQELEGLKPQEVLFKTADALANMENATKRVTAAERLLGGELGQRFLPLLQKGSEGIQQLVERADALGVVLGEETLEQSRAVKRSFDELLTLFKGVGLRIGAEVAPAVQDVVGRIRDWITANKDLIDQRIAEVVDDLSVRIRQFADRTAEAVQVADKFAQKVGGWVPLLERISQLLVGLGAGLAVKNLVTALSGLGSIISGLASALASSTFVTVLLEGGLASALGVLQLQLASLGSALAAAAGPIAVAVAALAGLAVAIEDVVTFFQGGDSITGQVAMWVDQNEQAREVVESLSEAARRLSGPLGVVGDVLMDIGRRAFRTVIDAGVTLASIIGELLKPVFVAVAGTLDFLLDLFNAVVALFQGDMNAATRNVEDAFRGLATTIKDVLLQTVQSALNALGELVDGYARVLERAAAIGGLDIDVPSLRQALDFNLTGSATPPRGGGPAGPSPTAPTPTPRASGSQGGGRSVRIKDNSRTEVNVEAPPGADEEQVARLAEEKVEQKRREQARKQREELVKGGER